MLVALFSSVENAMDSADPVRAFLPVAAKTVLQRQVEMARSLGAERFVVFAQGLPSGLVAIQHWVENQGGSFHAIAGPRALAGLVTTADDLILFGDGVLPEEAELHREVAEKRGVFALPADTAVSQGFERIDRDRAWAGILRTSGSDISRLADLPADIDPASALMRIAVQAGRPIIDLSAEVLSEGRWILVQSREQAAHVGRAIAQDKVGKVTWWSPFSAIASRLVLVRATAIPDASGPARALAIATILVGGIALAVGWYGLPPLALGILGLGGFLSLTATAFARISGRTESWFGRNRDHIFTVLFDVALIAILVWALGPDALRSLGFPLAVLLGMQRLAAVSPSLPLRGLANDRVLLSLLLVIAAAADRIVLGVQIIALSIMVAMLIDLFRIRLTRA